MKRNKVVSRLVQLNLFSFLQAKEPTSSDKSRPLNFEIITLDSGLMVRVKRRPRQRRWSLYVHSPENISIICNKTARENHLRAWLHEMEPWINKQRNRLTLLHEKFPKKQFIDGEDFPFLGDTFKLKFGSKNFLSRGDQQVFIGASPDSNGALRRKRVHEVYKGEAQAWIPQRVSYWSNCMGLYPKRVSLRGQKTRWGSCSSNATISINWKLIAAPADVVDYVIVHELAHLKHHNHSRKFWSLVDAYCPNYIGLRKWLKENQLAFEFLS